MPKFLLGLLLNIRGIIGGGINSALGVMTSILSSGFKMAVQFHQEGIAFSRQLGLNAKEAQAYTEVLTQRTANLANKYGVAADAIKEIQRGIVDATGKQYMLNDAEAERQLQINKLVGSQTASAFQEQMMNHMGGQLSAVQGAISKAYVTAAKSGLNAAKFSEKVARNLTLANKLSFRNGVDGIIKMTALSEKLGFNLQSVESAADKFMELDSAISTSAQLQMLGGAAGAFGSNPLTMSYEANYDPEALTERMTKMLGGYATFDRNTGMANVNGMNRDFVKNIAQAMGISMDEAMSIAKKQAEIKYKEGAFGRELGNISKENRDAVLNRSYVDTKTGHLMINDVSGKKHDITENGLDETIIEELQKFDNQTEKDIMREQAETLTSIDEQISGAVSSVAASFAKEINRYLIPLRNTIKDIGDFMKPIASSLGRGVVNIIEFIKPIAKSFGAGISDGVKSISKWYDENKETIKSIANFLGGALSKFIAFATEHWKLTLAAIIGWKLGSALLKIPLAGGMTVGGRLASRAASGIGRGLLSAGKFLVGGSLKIINSVGKFQVSWLRGIGSLMKGGFNVVKSIISTSANAVSKAWGLVRSGGSKLWNKQKAYNSTFKNAKTEFKKVKANAKRSYKNTLNRGGSKTRALNNVRKNIIKNIKSGTAIKSLGKTVLKGGLGAIGGMAINAGTDYLVNKGKIKKGGVAHYGGKMLGTAAEFAAMGSLLGPIGTGVGAAVGAIKGAYDTWKSLPENADKNFIDYAKSVGESIVEGGKKAFNWAKEKISDAASSMHKGIQERGGYLKVALNVLFAPMRWFINGVKELGKLILHPVDTITNAYTKLKNFFNSDNKLSTIWNKGKDLLFGSKENKENGAKPKESPKEKKAYGGIVGGNSYSGDRILIGANSGEMVLTKEQQAQLFNFINNASSTLTKVGAANGVTYYNASNSGFRKIDEMLGKMLNTTSAVFSHVFDPRMRIERLKTSPIGTNSFRDIPKYNGNNNNDSVKNVTVRDFNVNLSGTIRLDAGNLSKSIDASKLLEDSAFIASLKDMIKQSINNDINNGRFMNDIPSMRGLPSQVTVWGRK